jgi:hypothetical protein
MNEILSLRRVTAMESGLMYQCSRHGQGGNEAL